MITLQNNRKLAFIVLPSPAELQFCAHRLTCVKESLLEHILAGRKERGMRDDESKRDESP